MMYFLLFLEGILTFISPCILPLLPLYVSYFAAGEADRKRTLCNSLGFVAGFALVFMALGAFAGTVGSLLLQYALVVQITSGVVVVLLGLHFLGLLKLGFLQKLSRPQVNTRDLRFGSSFLFGLAFSIGWTPCVGPLLGIALTQAAQAGSTLHGTAMLLIYSLGLGLPLIICAMLMDQLKGMFSFLRRHQKKIHIASGILLIILGVLMATGSLWRLV